MNFSSYPRNGIPMGVSFLVLPYLAMEFTINIAPCKHTPQLTDLPLGAVSTV